MKKQSANRAYNFPDADLYLECIERIQYARRDLKDFETYSFDKARLDAFQKDCETFASIPSDDELLGVQMQLTEKKYEASEQLKLAVRSVMTRVAMKYHNRTGRYRRFGTQKMGDMTDAQLIFCGRRVIRVGTQMLPILQEVGLTEEHLSKVKEATIDFENAVHLQRDKVNDRDISVEKRTELGNKIYQELIVLSNIGKDIWIDRDPVRYEQYVIYESNADQKRARKERQKAEEDQKQQEAD